MRISTLRVTLTVAVLCATLPGRSPAGLGKIGAFFKSVTELVGVGEISDKDVAAGLKEALEFGTRNAVAKVSQEGGFWDAPEIRIPLPEKVQKVERALRLAGFGSKVDDFKLSMNRAAERAAPEAAALFWDAIKQMTIADAKAILQGADNAATQYFRDKTQDRLREAFRPLVHAAMGETHVTDVYQEIEAKLRAIPFVSGQLNLDLDGYVTERALDGLFVTLAAEEARIRNEPGARVTALLRKVFGAAGPK